jgi:transposase-like protein
MAGSVHPLECRQLRVELALAGESPEKLAKRLEPSSKTIGDWVKLASVARVPELNNDVEIRGLLKENEIPQEGRQIPKRAAAWFAMKSMPTRGRHSRS